MPDTPPRRWAVPPDVHDEGGLREDAHRRRRALEGAGLRRRAVA